MNILPGDPAPSFHAKSNLNPRFAFDTVGGRNVVLTFISNDDDCASYLNTLAQWPVFNDTDAALFIVTEDPAHEVDGALPLRIPGVRAFFDTNQNIANLYGLDRFPKRPVSFIINPRLQVIGLTTSPAADQASIILEILAQLPKPSQLPPMLNHAPVLVIPHVFEPELCKFLIEGYNKHGGKMSGFMQEVDGKTVTRHDTYHKIRRDWIIEEDKLIKTIQDRFLRRVVPEIKKAFQFNVTRMERYLVACYEAEDGGHFNPHRDNTTKGTAHRRFAVSLNLNADEYEGCDLRFPEFGPRTYRPPTGGCVVFSCSLLHEATMMTKDTRYAFLPFLYDEAARKIREENLQYLETEEDK